MEPRSHIIIKPIIEVLFPLRYLPEEVLNTLTSYSQIAFGPLVRVAEEIACLTELDVDPLRCKFFSWTISWKSHWEGSRPTGNGRKSAMAVQRENAGYYCSRELAATALIEECCLV